MELTQNNLQALLGQPLPELNRVTHDRENLKTTALLYKTKST